MLTNTFIFIIGAVVGSFLNVCIHRLPKSESIINPASHCPNCKSELIWYDNIPLISYLLLKGRCRFCKSTISFRYPLVEFLTAFLLLVLHLKFELTPTFYAYSILTSGLIIATFVDFEVQEIPDEVTIFGLIAGICLSLVFPSILRESNRLYSFLDAFVGALVGGASIYLMGFFGELVFKKEAMGGGDVKLLAMIGAFLGWKLVIVTFFLAPIFGSIVGIILKIKEGRQIIPYGPYLSLSALISVFFADRLLRFLFLFGISGY